jgi:hypothetical protein
MDGVLVGAGSLWPLLHIELVVHSRQLGKQIQITKSSNSIALIQGNVLSNSNCKLLLFVLAKDY